ncbi:MAG: hypothetical protein ACLQVF_22510 [Isosphaeraceae bacterium]
MIGSLLQFAEQQRYDRGAERDDLEIGSVTRAYRYRRKGRDVSLPLRDKPAKLLLEDWVFLLLRSWGLEARAEG